MSIQMDEVRAELTTKSGTARLAWVAAHRRAFLAGEFDDLCDHGDDMAVCEDLDCHADFEAIVLAYVDLIRVEAGSR